MYLWWSLCTFTRIPGDSHRRWFRSFLSCPLLHVWHLSSAISSRCVFIKSTSISGHQWKHLLKFAPYANKTATTPSPSPLPLLLHHPLSSSSETRTPSYICNWHLSMVSRGEEPTTPHVSMSVVRYLLQPLKTIDKVSTYPWWCCSHPVWHFPICRWLSPPRSTARRRETLHQLFVQRCGQIGNTRNRLGERR